MQERTLPVHIDKVCLCQKETLSFGDELVVVGHVCDFDPFFVLRTLNETP